jgi:acyl-CoA synthetase (AMP-forming)/AMP-acid ligase II
MSVSGGNAARFEYSLDGITWAPAVQGAFATSAGNSQVYGSAVSVQFRACRDATQIYCGAASAAYVAVPMATRAAVVSCVRDEEPTFSLPVNPGSDDADEIVTYELAYQRVDLVWGNFYASAPGETVPRWATAIRIKATVSIGGIAKTDPGYTEAECTSSP